MRSWIVTIVSLAVGYAIAEMYDGPDHLLVALGAAALLTAIVWVADRRLSARRRR
jgi:hypothetical protein